LTLFRDLLEDLYCRLCRIAANARLHSSSTRPETRGRIVAALVTTAATTRDRMLTRNAVSQCRREKRRGRVVNEIKKEEKIKK